MPNIVRNAPSLLSRDGIKFLITNPRVKVILVMLIYTLSPFDLLPEALLGPIGLFDDGFVILNLFKEVSALMISFSREQEMRNRIRNEERDGDERAVLASNS